MSAKACPLHKTFEPACGWCVARKERHERERLERIISEAMRILEDRKEVWQAHDKLKEAFRR